MMQWLLKLVRRDLGLKLLALSLAILFWAMVVQGYNKESTVTFDVSLEVIEHPEFEIYEGRRDRESTVQVQVTGPNLLVSNIAEGEIRAFVDYRQLTEPGRSYDVEVQVEGPARIAGRVRYRITPRTVNVTLVETKSMTVPVAVFPAEGVVAVDGREYTYKAAPVETMMEISGRADVLNYVRRADLLLEGPDLNPPLVNGKLKEGAVRIRKAVTFVDSTEQKVQRLPEHFAEALITWEELPPGMQVQVRTSTRGSLPPGYEVSGVTVDPAVITLRSATLGGELPDITEVETEPVLLDGQTQSFTTAVRVLPPQGTAAAQAWVNVTVSVRETSMERIFGAVPVVVENAPPAELFEVSVSSSTVQVRLRGPYTRTYALDAGSIQAYVDLSGLGEGQHQVPVKLSYPTGITEVLLDPAILEVVISKPS